jgi:hypothetical protein
LKKFQKILPREELNCQPNFSNSLDLALKLKELRAFKCFPGNLIIEGMQSLAEEKTIILQRT